MSEYHDWLANLKEDDRVAIALNHLGRARTRYRFSKVQRTTKLHIIIGDTKYQKSTGDSVGASVWSGTSLQQVTSEIHNSEMAARRYDAVRKVAWDTVSDATICQVLALVASEKTPDDIEANS